MCTITKLGVPVHTGVHIHQAWPIYIRKNSRSRKNVGTTYVCVKVCELDLVVTTEKFRLLQGGKVSANRARYAMLKIMKNWTLLKV